MRKPSSRKRNQQRPNIEAYKALYGRADGKPDSNEQKPGKVEQAFKEYVSRVETYQQQHGLDWSYWDGDIVGLTEDVPELVFNWGALSETEQMEFGSICVSGSYPNSSESKESRAACPRFLML